MADSEKQQNITGGYSNDHEDSSSSVALVFFSNETTNDYEAEVSHFETVGRKAMIYVYATIFVVGVTGNLWVLYWIAGRNRRAMKTVTNIFIFNLSVADLFLMLCLPTIITRMIIGEWIFGWFLCKIYFTFDGVNKFASVAFLVLLSLDRYLAVCHPITSRTFRNTNTAVGLVAVTWTIVGLLMVPVFIFANVKDMTNDDNRTMLLCAFLPYEPVESGGDNNNGSTVGGAGFVDPRRIFTFYTFALSYVLPLLLISVFYLLIVCRLKRQERLLGESTVITTNVRSIRKKKRTSRQISIMVLTIVAAYTFCWLPYWILQLGLELFPETLLNMGEKGFQVFSYIAYGLQISNSALNPFLYALGTDSHRREMLDFVCELCCVCCQWKKYKNSDEDEKSATGTTASHHLMKNRNSRRPTKRGIRRDTDAELSTAGGIGNSSVLNALLLRRRSDKTSSSMLTTSSSPAKSPKLKIPARPRSDLNLLSEVSEASVSNM